MKVSEYGVISRPYFPVFGLNTEIYGVSGHVSRSDEFKEFHFLMNIQVTMIMMTVRKIHNRPS